MDNAITEEQETQLRAICFHHQIGGESVLKVIQFAKEHGYEAVKGCLDRLSTEQPGHREGPYTRFYRMLQEKAGTLSQTPADAQHMARIDSQKFQAGTNEEEFLLKRNGRLRNADKPMEIFFGYERAYKDHKTRVSVQKKFGLFPSEKLMQYWRENGYGELADHYEKTDERKEKEILSRRLSGFKLGPVVMDEFTKPVGKEAVAGEDLKKIKGERDPWEE